MFSLLLRFNTVQKGTILIDGIDITKLRARELRNQVALVPQEGRVFSGSISDAISFGRHSTAKEIINAATIANAHKATFPDKSNKARKAIPLVA